MHSTAITHASSSHSTIDQPQLPSSLSPTNSRRKSSQQRKLEKIEVSYLMDTKTGQVYVLAAPVSSGTVIRAYTLY